MVTGSPAKDQIQVQAFFGRADTELEPPAGRQRIAGAADVFMLENDNFMSYAILQRELVVPDVESLKRAFSVSPILRDIDAQNAAHDAYGILLRGLDAENADALQASLQAEGVEIELVKETALPAIPVGRVTKRVSFGPGHLLAFDAMDRPTEVSWGDVNFIAAGYVRTDEVIKHRSAKEEAQLRAAAQTPIDEAGLLGPGDEERYHMLLEIFLRDGRTRYSISADEFLFDCLGEKLTDDLALNFVALVQMVIAEAPHAGLNRGAFKASQEPPELFPYPSRGAFNEELTWMLWRINSLQP